MSLLQAFIKKVSTVYAIEESELLSLYNGTKLPDSNSSPTCVYTFIKSIKKGQQCGKPSKVGPFCTKHSKSKEIQDARREKVLFVESEDEHEDASYY